MELYPQKYLWPANPANLQVNQFEETEMIDPDTIDDIDEVDGEEVFCHGYDPSVKEWKWDWVPYDHLADAGRSDIIERIWGI